MDLSKFKPYTVSPGVATITIGKNGLAFSKTAVIRLGKPEYVELLVNDDDKIIVIRALSEQSETSTNFFKPGKKNIMVRWNYQDLIERIAEMMNWDTENKTYKVRGEYHPEDNLLSFSLKNASVLGK
ncbi:hypothetical protein [Lactiplantibacillus pentosus]|uniref:Uncharacterized protein n=1 Tax=Lactiplantibacillus pentosus TaxID=1589 RepID=A0AAX6LGP8_LACPE|nr:hypothetical protein [Lactiplantibacillus pentosus]ASG79779.1 hypothetical protein CEW82_07970 [Lactiplantibacillus pentosus]AYJ40470.1 hypothetical protein LP314_00370 [Lactiplantibacillus pentosus]MBU7498206.1 hypothetical protein [Lactiplantibacillus pentosus]MCT3295427.1 hypothetical protein [Lactiplantibacillus pentosus]MCT3298146.1 hypothetical protein [Lactiplantibacillus pentosus]